MPLLVLSHTCCVLEAALWTRMGLLEGAVCMGMGGLWPSDRAEQPHLGDSRRGSEQWVGRVWARGTQCAGRCGVSLTEKAGWG